MNLVMRLNGIHKPNAWTPLTISSRTTGSAEDLSIAAWLIKLFLLDLLFDFIHQLARATGNHLPLCKIPVQMLGCHQSFHHGFMLGFLKDIGNENSVPPVPSQEILVGWCVNHRHQH